jgi:hypothetical protein
MTVTTAREMSEDQRVGLDEAPPAGLRLQPDRSGRGPLDGGWWPRSADPATAGNLEQAPAFLAAVGPGLS